jgi:hypothetical protein
MDRGADELEHQLFTAHDCSQKSSSISSSDDDSGNSSEEDSGEEADNSSEGDEDSDVSQFGIEFNLLNTIFHFQSTDDDQKTDRSRWMPPPSGQFSFF